MVFPFSFKKKKGQSCPVGATFSRSSNGWEWLATASFSGTRTPIQTEPIGPATPLGYMPSLVLPRHLSPPPLLLAQMSIENPVLQLFLTHLCIQTPPSFKALLSPSWLASTCWTVLPADQRTALNLTLSNDACSSS